VVKAEVCKTSIQRFESARRLHLFLTVAGSDTGMTKKIAGTFGTLTKLADFSPPVRTVEEPETTAVNLPEPRVWS
jgi:hypothetical protein